VGGGPLDRTKKLEKITMLKQMAFLTLTAVLSISPIANADSNSDREVNYRQAVYSVIGGQMGVLAGMARGERDYNQAEAQLAAETIAQLAKISPSVFAAHTIGVDGSDALPAINDDRASFDAAMTRFQEASLNLAQELDGAEAFPRPAFGRMAQSCKGCHDKFKAD
jgi:cytochrome c556